MKKLDLKSIWSDFQISIRVALTLCGLAKVGGEKAIISWVWDLEIYKLFQNHLFWMVVNNFSCDNSWFYHLAVLAQLFWLSRVTFIKRDSQVHAKDEIKDVILTQRNKCYAFKCK